MRHILSVIAAALLVLVSVVSCGKASGPNPDEVAAQAAKAYYGYLVDGKYDAYVDGFYQPDSIPPGYREQLITNAKMFASQQKEEHGGIKSIGIAGAKADTAKHVAHVFLVFNYGNGDHEQVVVPLVLVGGNWMLK